MGMDELLEELAAMDEELEEERCSDQCTFDCANCVEILRVHPPSVLCGHALEGELVTMSELDSSYVVIGQLTILVDSLGQCYHHECLQGHTGFVRITSNGSIHLVTQVTPRREIPAES